MDESGSVIGVVVGKLNAIRVADATGDIPQNVNFAVSLDALRKFLVAQHVPFKPNAQEVNKSSADVAAEGASASVYLECWK